MRRKHIWSLKEPVAGKRHLYLQETRKYVPSFFFSEYVL